MEDAERVRAVCSVIPTACGSGAFSLEEGRIAPLPLPRHVVRGDYLECGIVRNYFLIMFLYYQICAT